jgi:hypothetical protein
MKILHIVPFSDLQTGFALVTGQLTMPAARSTVPIGGPIKIVAFDVMPASQVGFRKISEKLLPEDTHEAN